MVDGLKEISHRTPDLNIRFNSNSKVDFSCQSPAILNFSFPPVEGEVMVHHLEKKNIYIGMGSACSSHSKEPSQILTGIGLSDEEARCGLRVSFGPQNSLEDVDTFLKEFTTAYQLLFPTFNQKQTI